MNAFISHARDILRIGMPIVIGMLAIVGFGITDTLVAGRASAEDLAALALGTNIWSVAIVLVVGLMAVVTPRIAHARGAKDTREVAHEGRQAIWLASAVGLLASCLLYWASGHLALFGAEPSVTQTAEAYLAVIAWSLWPIGTSIAIRAYCDGFARTRIAMTIYLIGLPLNLLLNIWFVFGGWGLPAMGAVGCAISSCLVAVVELLCFVVVLRVDKELKQTGLLARFEWPERKRLGQLLLLGLPVALALALEEGFFSASTLMIAPLGTTSLGAHQVAVNLVTIGIMVIIGVGQGGSILVAEALGAEKATKARTLCQHTVILGMVVGLLVAACLFLWRSAWLTLFSDNPALLGLGIAVLAIVPLELICECALILSGQLLRGYQDVQIPALIQTCCYWLLGFPLGFLLTRTEYLGGPYGLTGLWWAFVVAVGIGAVLALWRLWYITQLGAWRSAPLADVQGQ